ncbi:hypothetical protein PHYC_01114 [Phycisphaerales bacterium]|nr:hypothetical protein PHYC_01114 [Phycisphaerales bacterium]
MIHAPAILAAFLLLSPPARPSVQQPPPRDGISCALYTCEVESRLNMNQNKPESTGRIDRIFGMSAMVTSLRPATPFRVLGMEITQVLDDQGRNLASELKRPSHENYKPGRREIAEAFTSCLRPDQDARFHANDSIRGLPRLPAWITRATARVDVLAAGKVHRETIPLKAVEEAVEVAPGLTFLLTKAEARLEQFQLGFEVRVRKFREGDAKKPGTEPVFGGLILTRHDGTVFNVINYGQEIELRDETIIMVQDATFDRAAMAQIAKAEIIVFDDLHVIPFEITVEDFPVFARE